ncbi:bifunctional lysylphosphatidylglycerol flippase/synthetase MprF [Kushneria sp. Sum13]|uniref:bifunctional lysylphosphatidylglycerol flippase/synthetase MprF n=1 Tax=Kushneria sp. Sum13 TaxID=3459196 RepID=UPI0040465421
MAFFVLCYPVRWCKECVLSVKGEGRKEAAAVEQQEADASVAVHERWHDLFHQHRHRWQAGLILLLFVLALLACWHLLEQMNPALLHGAIMAVPSHAVVLAVLTTLFGFVSLIGYEWSAARFAGVTLPWRVLVTGGLCAPAIGNAVGLSMLSGAAVRSRLYGVHGVGGREVMRMSGFTSLALGGSLPLLAAMAVLLAPSRAAQLLSLPMAVAVSAAGAVLALYLVLVLWWRRGEVKSDAGVVHVSFRRWCLSLPTLRLAGNQCLITLLDVVLAAGTLYLLLPHAPVFPAFVIIYLLALAGGVLSHVPGGVGVFEAIMLAALSHSVGLAPLTAGLLLYRLIYVVLPLLLGCVALLFMEARRSRRARTALAMASGMAAPTLSLLVFLTGVVLLFSGVTPAVSARLDVLGELVPHRLVDASHLAASLIGVLCLLLANGLRRRLSAAWALTLGLLLLSSVLSLLKGLDWEEAGLALAVAGLLLVFRRAFYRPSRLMQMPVSPFHLLACLCVVLASLWIMFFVYQDVPYRNRLWWQFALDAQVPRALRAELGSALLMAGIALAWLIRTQPGAIILPDEAARQRAASIINEGSHPEGWLAMTGDKAFLFNDSQSAFIMYARHGRSMVALFDPVGPASERAEMIWRFRDLCDRHHARPVFYQVRAENLHSYMDIGLSAVKLGEEARVDLRTFNLESKQHKGLRYSWNRGQRDGLSIEFLAPGEAPLAQLEAISDAWRLAKSAREKSFSLGRFTASYLAHFPVALVRYNGEPVAFANLLETHRGREAGIDLMRAGDQAPKLAMEFLMIGLILHYQARGLEVFSLGMVPMAGMQPRAGAPLAQRLGAVVYRYGEHFYNFQGLKRFKDKFDPCWEPRYMAVPAGLDPLVALKDTAALIAGGYTGLVRR